MYLEDVAQQKFKDESGMQKHRQVIISRLMRYDRSISNYARNAL